MAFHTDGVLFQNTFGTPEMREIVSEETFIQRFLEAEAALARAEARADVIPQWAADEITEKATLEYVDLEAIEQYVADLGLFTVAILEAWKESFDGAEAYVHWGTTSQDICDLAMVLQLRQAHEAILEDVRDIEAALVDLAEAHATTPMIGRTHAVHATPITFGLKAATWLDEVHRHRRRLEDLPDRLFVVELFGASGTLSAIDERGPTVQASLADDLDLAVPDAPWFALRDRFVEFADVLASLATTLGRIADQILLATRPELGELGEPIPEDEVGSSTMPHKRNPFRSMTVSGLAHLVRGHASTMRTLNTGMDERDISTWLMEFAILPELCLYVSRQTTTAETILSDLVIDVDAMAENLHHHGDLVCSEAVMMRLAREIGRSSAHHLVHEHAMTAVTEDRSFSDLLASDDRVTDHLSAAELAELTDPEAYIGYAETFVRRTVASVRETWE